MAVHKAKKLSDVSNVITLPTAGNNSLESAINVFLLWEMRSHDCIEVKRCYIDVAEDLESGILLSQIVYWHLPDKQGHQKLTVHRDDYWWLAKAREDWWAECRLTPKQFDRAIRHLEEQQLVCTKVYKWQGQNTKHVRLDWAGLLQSLSLLDANKNSVVGFRRRDPVPGSGRRLGKKTSLDIPELPNRKSLNNLLGNSQITYQVNSELPDRELHLYTEITPEITLSPNPSQEGELEGEGERTLAPEQEPPTTSPNTLTPQPDLTADAFNQVEDQGSEAASLNGNQKIKQDSSRSAFRHTHPTQKTEDYFRNRRDLPPWRKSWGRNNFDEGFVDYVCTHHLSDCSKYQTRKPTPHRARTWITKQEDTEIGWATLENMWAEYQDFLVERRLIEQQRSPIPTPTVAALNHVEPEPTAEELKAKEEAIAALKRQFAQAEATPRRRHGIS